MQSANIRRSGPVLRGYAPKQPAKQPSRQPKRLLQRLSLPVQALLCAALLMPGLALPDLTMPVLSPGTACAAEKAQEKARQEAVQKPVQKPVEKPVQDKVQDAPARDGTASKDRLTPETAMTAQTSETEAAGPQTSGPRTSETAETGGLHLPSITDFAPGSVYSGTLGELTRLQAGQEMARAALSLKEIQARILEVENSMAKARRELSEERAREEAGNANASLQEAMNELKAGFEALAEDVAALRLEKEKAHANERQCLVLSVRSQGARLVAELATKDGRFLAGAGDRVPGVGRIDTVSRSKVTAEGRSLPWK